MPVPDSLYMHSEDGITLHVIVGVYEWERTAERPLIFDLRVDSPHPLHLNRALITQQLEAWLAESRYRLLEALAEHLCACMLAEWHCNRVTLGIEKPGALGDIARVGIRIARQNRPASHPAMPHLLLPNTSTASLAPE